MLLLLPGTRGLLLGTGVFPLLPPLQSRYLRAVSRHRFVVWAPTPPPALRRCSGARLRLHWVESEMALAFRQCLTPASARPSPIYSPVIPTNTRVPLPLISFRTSFLCRSQNE